MDDWTGTFCRLDDVHEENAASHGADLLPIILSPEGAFVYSPEEGVHFALGADLSCLGESTGMIAVDLDEQSISLSLAPKLKASDFGTATPDLPI